MPSMTTARASGSKTEVKKLLCMNAGDLRWTDRKLVLAAIFQAAVKVPSVLTRLVAKKDSLSVGYLMVMVETDAVL